MLCSFEQHFAIFRLGKIENLQNLYHTLFLSPEWRLRQDKTWECGGIQPVAGTKVERNLRNTNTYLRHDVAAPPPTELNLAKRKKKKKKENICIRGKGSTNG